eukprot:6182265-Pleurochrysis_carterae.AAC.3
MRQRVGRRHQMLSLRRQSGSGKSGIAPSSTAASTSQRAQDGAQAIVKHAHCYMRRANDCS